MRSYGKKKRTIDNVEAGDDRELPPLPPTRPHEAWTIAATVRSLNDRDPTKFSDKSQQVWHRTIDKVDVVLQKTHLLEVQHQNLQAKLREDHNKKAKSRKRSHKGGPSASVAQLRDEIQEKDDKYRADTIRKARKKLTAAVNKARNNLKDLGIRARKDEKARLALLAEYKAKDDSPPVELLTPIREPDKNPTALELARCQGTSTRDFSR